MPLCQLTTAIDLGDIMLRGREKVRDPLAMSPDPVPIANFPAHLCTCVLLDLAGRQPSDIFGLVEGDLLLANCQC